MSKTRALSLSAEPPRVRRSGSQATPGPIRSTGSVSADSNSEWADADHVRPTFFGIGPDRPAIRAPPAGTDEASSVGVEQHAAGVTGLEMGQFAPRVGLPEADAGLIAGRHQPLPSYTTSAEVSTAHTGGVLLDLGAVAEHAGVKCPTLLGQGDVPDADLSTRHNLERQPAVVARERALRRVTRRPSPGALPTRRPKAGSCYPSSRSPAGNPGVREASATSRTRPVCPSKHRGQRHRDGRSRT